MSTCTRCGRTVERVVRTYDAGTLKFVIHQSSGKLRGPDGHYAIPDDYVAGDPVDLDAIALHQIKMRDVLATSSALLARG